MLDAEAALAWALADTGRTGPDAARAVAEQCRAERFAVDALGAAAAAGGNPVIPLVEALRAAVGPSAAAAVHTGATSQDILDTAAMLVAARAIDAVLVDLGRAADRAATLAVTYRATPMMGRTLLQQALPTTFGLVAATWATGLDAAGARLADVRSTRLAAQLGGPAGTLSGYGAAGGAVVERFAARARAGGAGGAVAHRAEPHRRPGRRPRRRGGGGREAGSGHRAAGPGRDRRGAARRRPAAAARRRWPTSTTPSPPCRPGRRPCRRRAWPPPC